jgi:hypothetical protein
MKRPVASSARRLVGHADDSTVRNFPGDKDNTAVTISVKILPCETRRFSSITGRSGRDPAARKFLALHSGGVQA